MGEALSTLRAAVEAFAAETGDQQAIVSQALLVYEIVGFDSDGDPYRKVSYSIPTDNFSLSGGLGLIEAARYYIRRDALGIGDD